MPRRIQVLPDTLANQIAAGEVVERPASVVKELVENALDAAATRIDVSIQNGGKTEIRVADDGCGMGRDDALLALDRYATSKIARPEDLKAVRTFGFRGEALPSIASVSRLTVETAEAGDVGTRVRVAGGRILGAEDCARQAGTTILVQNLFFNVPARAKFLRSAAVETRAVVDTLTTLALANLSAAFRLESNGRALLELPAAADLATRVADLWGDDTARRFLGLAEHGEGGIVVAGLVERPDAAAPTPRRAHLFVAGRPFRDRPLLAAVDRAYRTTIPQGVRPSVLLYLDVPAGAVDVNVHPTKAEVRFRDRAAVEAAVEASVRAALGRVESAATLDSAPARPQLRRTEPVTPAADGGAAANQLAFFVAAANPAETDAPRPDAAGAEPAPLAVPAAERPPSLWQLHDTYILAESRSGLIMIDQHSAHERILFEQLMRGFADGGQASQRLLFPLTLRLSPAEYAVVEDSLAFFQRAGFEIEPFGGRTVIVHAAPVPHPYFNPERCLREMVAELAAGSELTRAARNQHERIAMTFACKGAIKAGQRLSPREMQELFDRLFATELPHHDVHGRPTVVRLSLHELERRFGRHG
ncbi:MAG TPA: DNA mismatch repair endonuclease MutL [Longimicrobiales bacterium]|nr:DNA mismatch repair endonuclease MutL [Longimicrobiales bacterium]